MHTKIWTTCVWLFCLLGVGLTVSGCTQSGANSPEAEQANKHELILAVGGEPENGFDPTTGWGRYGSPLFQSTLLKRDVNFNIVNDLATGYDISDDGTVWTVQLRDDVVFSDGEPLTAEDVVFTFQTAANSGSVIDLTNLERVEAPDRYTVQFTLEKPQSTFIQALIATGIVPQHAYGDNYKEHPIGSGPFQFVQWDKGQQLIVAANPHYYGETPYFTKLTFLFLSEDAAFAAAKAGGVDLAAIPPAFANQDVEDMHVVALDSVDNRGIMFPFVREKATTENGALIGNDVTADPAIRQAVNIAIDRRELVEGVLAGYGTPAYSVSDQLPWWNAETVIQDGDPERAKRILKEAGWRQQEDGVLQKDGLKAAFTLLYPAGDQVRQSLALAVADMVKEVGIEVTVEGKSWEDLQMMMHANPVLMGWGSQDPLEMYHLYSSEARGLGWYNANFYSNETVDRYMEQALRATDEEEANEYWKKAQWDGKTGFSAKGDAPWAWLVNLKHVYLVRDGLDIGEQKIQPHKHGWPITDFVEQWRWTDSTSD